MCSNGDCRILWLDPIPDPSELWKAYRTYYTHPDYPDVALRQDLPRKVFRAAVQKIEDAYLARTYHYDVFPERSTGIWLALLAWMMPWRRTDWDVSVMFLPSLAGGRLLEVGCGSGKLLANLARKSWNVEGLDLDPLAVENARRRGLEVRLGDLESQHYPDDCFDAVVMSHVIEHVVNPSTLLLECYRILKPGGILSLITPNALSLGHRMFGKSWYALEPPRHLHVFSPAALSQLTAKCGFRESRTFTTVRDGDGLFATSLSIRLRGTTTMGAGRDYRVKASGRIAQMLEWFLVSIFPDVGEELSFIGTK